MKNREQVLTELVEAYSMIKETNRQLKDPGLSDKWLGILSSTLIAYREKRNCLNWILDDGDNTYNHFIGRPDED